MKNSVFVLWLIVAALLTFVAARLIDNAYFYFAGYVVLQYIALATAWNILGGYTGYVNFGIPAFIALGAYSTVVLHKTTNLPLIVMMLVGGIVSGLVGVGTGYLTLRLRGTFFSIATLAMAVVMQTLVTNWAFVGGSRGAYIIRPATVQYLGIDYIQYLFLMMLGLCVLTVGVARAIEKSRLGYGFATIRDDELAAEASGVPTLRLKLIATGLSGGFMGMVGAPLALLRDLPRSRVGVQSQLRGQHDRHAVDRRHVQLARANSGGDSAGHAAAGRDGHHLVGAVAADRRRHAGGVRGGGAKRHHRVVLEMSAARDATAPILQVSGLGKRFGGFVALADVELAVARGERLGLIGPNGSGKSTLVNCLCGTLRNELGSVRFEGRVLDGQAAHQRTRAGLARTFQLPRPFGTLTLAENLRIPILYAVHGREGGSAANINDRCIALLETVGLAAKSNRLPKDLTQIEMRKLELARAMAAEPRLLIADEAMAGLSHGEVDDILALLVRLNEEQGITIILIEHIMRAVLSFSQRLVVLVAGRKIADGDPRDVVRQSDVVAAYLGS